MLSLSWLRDLVQPQNTQNWTLIIFLQEYTDDIIELIVNQYMDPGDVCNAIGLCP